MLIDEEIESAEAELEHFEKENGKSVKHGFLMGGLLTAAAVATAATVWMTPIGPFAAVTMGCTLGAGVGNVVSAGIDAVWGKLKKWSLRKKITDLKRIQQGQKSAQNFQRGRTQENSRSGRLYEEQKAKEAQLRDMQEKNNRSIDGSTGKAAAAFAATCIISPFFGPGAILGGLLIAGGYATSSVFKSIKAFIKERKVKKQIGKIRSARMAEGMRSRGNVMSRRMENLSHNGSRPVSRSYLRGEMPKLPVHPRSTSNTRNVVSRPQRED